MLHRGPQVNGAGVPLGQFATNVQALAVLGDLQPLAHRDLPGAVVEEHSNLTALRLQGRLESPGQDDVAVAIDDAEHARIALENALGAGTGELDLGLVEGQGLFDAWHLQPPE
ncbi:hypothetical protein D3C81_1842620 [compost metagenome]